MRLGVEHRGIAVSVGERFGDRPLGQSGHLAEHLAGGVDVDIGVVARTENLVESEDLEKVEFLVTNVALVVAHCVLLVENATCGWVLRSKLPTSNWAELYRSVTSTQSRCEQFPCLSNPVVGREP